MEQNTNRLSTQLGLLREGLEKVRQGTAAKLDNIEHAVNSLRRRRPRLPLAQQQQLQYPVPLPLAPEHQNPQSPDLVHAQTLDGNCYWAAATTILHQNTKDEPRNTLLGCGVSVTRLI